jgi:transposase
VFAPREQDGPAKWWLWVFIGPDTTCLVMDPTPAGKVLARHAGIDEGTGQLAGDRDGPWQVRHHEPGHPAFQRARGSGIVA